MGAQAPIRGGETSDTQLGSGIDLERSTSDGRRFMLGEHRGLRPDRHESKRSGVVLLAR